MDVSDDLLLWVDVETTALDPDDGELLEVGMALTDMRGEPGDLKPENWVLRHRSLKVTGDTVEAIGGMHAANGLLDACISRTDNVSDELAVRAVTRKVNDFIDAAVSRLRVSNRLHIAGANPQFDIRWIRAKLPDVSIDRPRISHRRMDLSAIRLSMKAVGRFDEMNEDVPQTNHRAMQCLQMEMAQYRRFVSMASK